MVKENREPIKFYFERVGGADGKKQSDKMNGYRSMVSRQKNDVLSLSLRRKRKGDGMAKAVLVMDMPECCADCQLADDDQADCIACLLMIIMMDQTVRRIERVFARFGNCQSIGARSVKKVSRIGY